jgi:hypothetical protein
MEAKHPGVAAKRVERERAAQATKHKGGHVR